MGMEQFDVDSLLQEISVDFPCGRDLEENAEFTKLEREQEQPKPGMAGATDETKQIPWPNVENHALALFSRTKDLRVAVWLTRARLNTVGLPGLSDGLRLIAGLLERYWDSVYPRLDAEDNDDPTERINALNSICHRETFLPDLRMAPLIVSEAFGPIRYRDIAIGRGQLKPVGETKGERLKTNQIEVAFSKCDAEQLLAAARTAKDARDQLGNIETLLVKQLGMANAPYLGPMAVLLKAIHDVLDKEIEKRGLTDSVATKVGKTVKATVSAIADKVGARSGPEGEPAMEASSQTEAIGEIRSREDVVRLLDTICAYYERNEPSSPVPIFLKRAKRLVYTNFLEAVRDLAPDGLAQAELISGRVEQETGGDNDENKE